MSAAGYTFHGVSIPDYMAGGLERWIEHGIPPGDFLWAVLTNDLREAIGRADDTNIHALPAYVAYLYNAAPSQCWGSQERCIAWAKQHESRRNKEASHDPIAD
jgi:hypothetical protein